MVPQSGCKKLESDSKRLCVCAMPSEARPSAVLRSVDARQDRLVRIPSRPPGQLSWILLCTAEVLPMENVTPDRLPPVSWPRRHSTPAIS